MKKLINIISVSLLVFITIGLRLYKIDTRPGYEWDEPVYTSISSNYLNLKYPAIKLEGSQGYGLYLYHPPFDFLLKSIVLKYYGFESIAVVRIVSVFMSVSTLLIIFLFIKRLTNTKTSTITTILIASDAWLIYTNRLNLIENELFLLGTISMFFYFYAVKTKKILFYVLSGILIGVTTIYKHTGVCFLLVPLFNLFFTRKYSNFHKYLYIPAFLIILLYLLSMYLFYKNIYIEQTFVQIKRTLGIFESRGTQYSVVDAIKAVFSTYWIYFTTIVTLILGVLLVIVNTTKFVLSKVKPKYPILLSWCLATLLFYGFISLKAPQYLIMLIIPMYIYISCYFSSVLSLKKNNHYLILFMVVALLVNTFTYTERFIFRNDNALLDTFIYMNNQVSQNSVVLTEESIGVGIKQIYYKLDSYYSKQNIDKIRPSYVIVYLSSTQKLPKSQELKDFLKQSTLIKEIRGFKERIYIYKTGFSEIVYSF